METAPARPPEGGWGWLIVMAVGLSKMAFWGALPCFGVLFADVLQSKPELEGSAVTSITGVNAICVSIIGIFCPALYKRGISLRQVGVLGGIIYFIGSFISIFVVSIPQLIFSFAVLQGFGYGLMMSTVLVAFNAHFRRRRTVAMAVAHLLVGVGSLGLGSLAQWLHALFGPLASRGCFSAFSVVAGAAQWVLRLPPCEEPREASQGATAAAAGNSDHCDTPALPCEEGETLLEGAQDMKKIVESETCPKITFSNLENTYQKRMPKGMKRMKNALLRIERLSGLDYSLLRKPQFLSVACCLGFVHVADTSIFLLLPLHIQALGKTGAEVTRVVTAAYAGDLGGRILLILVGRVLANRNRLTYGTSALLTAIAIVVISFVEDVELFVVLAAVMGVCKAAVYITHFLTIAETVEPKLFPAAVAFYFCAQIVASLVASAIIGLARDLSGSFPVCFRAAAALLAACPIVWGVQWASNGRPVNAQRRSSGRPVSVQWASSGHQCASSERPVSVQ